MVSRRFLEIYKFCIKTAAKVINNASKTALFGDIPCYSGIWNLQKNRTIWNRIDWNRTIRGLPVHHFMIDLSSFTGCSGRIWPLKFLLLWKPRILEPPWSYKSPPIVGFFPDCPPFLDFFSKEKLAILVRFFDFSLLSKRFLKKNISRGDGQGKIWLLGMITMTIVVLKIEFSIMVEILGVISLLSTLC